MELKGWVNGENTSSDLSWDWILNSWAQFWRRLSAATTYSSKARYGGGGCTYDPMASEKLNFGTNCSALFIIFCNPTPHAADVFCWGRGNIVALRFTRYLVCWLLFLKYSCTLNIISLTCLCKLPCVASLFVSKLL